MSYCENCGAELKEGALFCGKCGEKVEGVPGGTIAEETKTSAGFQKESDEAKGSKIKKIMGVRRNRIIFGVVIILVIIAVVLLSIRNYEKKKVNLNECLKVTFTGYDTVGTVKAEIDSNKFGLAVLKAQGKEKSSTTLKDYSLNDLKNDFSLASLEDSVKVTVSPTGSLKNGDTVTVSMTYNKDTAKDSGVVFVTKEEKYTVSGLKKITEIDPFKDLDVTFEGIAPNATLSMKYKGTDGLLTNYKFKADKDDKINIGDKITVTADVDADQALQQGFKVTQLTKQYTCDKADSYITKNAELKDSTIGDLKKETSDKIEARFASETSYMTISNLNYEGSYILTKKKMDGWSAPSYVYVVYSATVDPTENEKEYFTSTKVFIPVKFSNLIQKADGTQIFDTDYATMAGSTSLGNSFMAPSICGYTDPAAMYNDIITSNKDDFTYDVGSNLQQFGN